MLGDYWLVNELAKEHQTTTRPEANHIVTGVFAHKVRKASAVAVSLFFVLSVIF